MAKLFVTLAILCVFGAVLVKAFDKNEAMASFLAKMDECKAESGAKDGDVEELMNKKLPTTMEGKCLLLCLMQKYEVMDDQGKFVKDTALSHAEKFTDGDEERMKIAREIIDTCMATDVDSDHCVAAEQYEKCFQEQIAAHGIKDHFEF